MNHAAAPVGSYDRTAVALHWLIGFALFAQLAFGLALDDLAPRGAPQRAVVINLHKSLGLVLGLAVVARIVWRLRHRPPPWPATVAANRRRLIRAGHAALYLAMLGVPVAGYLAANFSRHGVHLFNVWPLPPWGPDWPALYRALGAAHVVLAWALCALVAGHVALALKHRWIDRDGLFDRMWPRARR